MVKYFYSKIQNNVGYGVEHREEIISLFSTFLVIAGTFVGHFVFMFFFLLSGVPKMAFVNFSSLFIAIYGIYLVAYKNESLKTIYVAVFMYIYYVIGATWCIGSESNVNLIMPALLVGVFTLYNLSKKHVVIITTLILLAHAFLIYLKYARVVEPIDNFLIVESINIVFAYSGCAFALRLRKIANAYYDKYNNNELAFLAREVNKDHLTKLWNRRYLKTEFKHINVYKRFYVVLADIDFFKDINDTYGHDAGDYILEQLSKMFLERFLYTDVICRWGGEEFLFILKHSSNKESLDKLESLRKEIEAKEFIYNETSIKLTVSFGVHDIKSKDDIEDGIKKSDIALYSAKKNGRNRIVIYDEDMSM